MTTLAAVADRLARGEPLQAADAAVIRDTPDLIAVGTLADEVRRQMHGDVTTFVRVFEMHVDAVPASLPAGTSAGEFRLTGTPVSLEVARAAVTAARRLAGTVPLTGFSLADLVGIDAAQPGALRDLAEAGLEAVAEAPVDRLTAPGACVERARAAGLAVYRLTVHAPAADPAAIVAAAVELQRTAGGFQAFAPLPRTMPAAVPTTGYDDVKLVALARLLARDIPSIQVDWPLYGPKLAQVALTTGADDVDGVAAVETGELGRRRSALEDINRNIRAAGLQPVERNGRYERLG